MEILASILLTLGAIIAPVASQLVGRDRRI